MHTENKPASGFWSVLHQAQKDPSVEVWTKVEKLMMKAGFNPNAGSKLAVPAFFLFTACPSWVVRTQAVPWPTLVSKGNAIWLAPVTDAVEVKSQAFLKTIFNDRGIDWKRCETAMKTLGFAPEKGGRLMLPIVGVTVTSDIPYWATLSRRYSNPVLARETQPVNLN